MTDEKEGTRHAVLLQMKANAQIWSNLLSTTGGALELSKCSYHVMAWQFTGRGSPVLIADPRNYAGVTVIDPISGGEKVSNICHHTRHTKHWDITKNQLESKKNSIDS